MFVEDIEKLEKFYDLAIEYLVTYSFQLLAAVIIFLLFLLLANKVGKLLNQTLVSKKVDITLSQFLANLVKFIILAAGCIVALGKIGISITPFVAAIGAASLGAGLALQGMLSNYGAGLAIILTRPFTLGNTITIRDITGVVKEVKLASTILVNEEEEDIIIPNKFLIGDVLHNSYQNKLVDTRIGVSYDSDVKLAIKLISDILEEFSGVDNSKPAQIGIDEFADSSINIGVRYWATTQSYYDIKYQVNMAIFEALTLHNIKIPFPQREIKILNGELK
ncbi:mechanosensitive ion channel protein MscS [Catenovulum agarivorans DS-2]|uniref:Small-conductance mechanosensitive channel n=1 Tax=Catenovulum agarivorans DS-2 TaxID=1328313 RepID=W7QGX5_9ALTE|nr:mechanosensitive ion channel domain-containing protein [Catenovulum agarivorans]EWH12194.1 mechanosensitive ion channel protein MscS [Catenovulum agarivorans DS-2]